MDDSTLPEEPKFTLPIDAAVGADGIVTSYVACVRCGYDLRDIDLDSLCPKCATTVRQSVGGPGIARDGLITFDVPCGRCGYSLKGLNIAQVCPECGTAARPSVIGAKLEAASPRYVAMLHHGSVCVLVATVLMVLAGAVQVLLGVLGAFVTPTSTMLTGMGVIGLLVGIASLAAVILFMVGWWILTARDPVRRESLHRDRARRTTRVGILLLFSVPIALVMGIGLTMIGWAIGAILALMLIAGSAVATLAGLIIQYFGSLNYISGLSERMARGDAIADLAKVMMWAGPLLMIGGACPGSLLQSAGRPSMSLGLIGAAFLMMPVAAWVMYWVLMERVRRSLKEVRVMQRGEIAGS